MHNKSCHEECSAGVRYGQDLSTVSEQGKGGPSKKDTLKSCPGLHPES